MSWLGLNEIPAAMPSRPRVGTPTLRRVRMLIPTQRQGARDGSFTVRPQQQNFDFRPPLLPVSDWTPWGWYSPVPGQTMESF